MVQVVEYNKDNRIETGAAQFGDDWPGLFIRGDDCIYLMLCLEDILDNYETLSLKEKLYVGFLKMLIEEIKNNVLIKPKGK